MGIYELWIALEKVRNVFVSRDLYFIPFLLNVKIKKQLRLQWARLIKRHCKKGGKLWMPKSSLRLCSKHFISGKPPKENPHPVLNLGYVAAKHVERKSTVKRIKNLGKRKRDDEEIGINKRTKSSDQPESEIKANCRDWVSRNKQEHGHRHFYWATGHITCQP